MSDMRSAGSLLSVRGLHVNSAGPGAGLLCGVDLDLDPGQGLALVGPSGCGKSLTALAVLGLLPPELSWHGSITWRGAALRDPRSPAWHKVRGRGLGLVLQDPLTGLNPVLRVGDQIGETVQVHRGLSRRAGRTAALDLLAETLVPDPETAARCYPHQLSGGMRQRVLLAAALACEPELLIADEPTTALDVSVQKEILALIRRVRAERGMALLFITHDLNLVPLLTEQVAVMADGRVSHRFAADQAELPPVPEPPSDAVDEAAVVLSARDLHVHYQGRSLAAVRGIDLDLRAGRAVGLVGESGSGKTSVGRALARQLTLSGGVVKLAGVEAPPGTGAAARAHRRRVQMLFQDPGASLNPRQTVASVLREALPSRAGEVVPLLAEVGLGPELLDRFPHQLSGGQRQRVALARCLAPGPQVLVADEPTSALDQPLRVQVLDLLSRIMVQRGLALLVISHDLDALQGICHEVHVMKGGVVVEVLPGNCLAAARHPYTMELLRALPRTLREQAGLWSAPALGPSVPPTTPGTGCPHHGGCPLQKAICGKELPPLKMLSNGRRLRCPMAEDTGSPHFIDTL
jgi:oligopeptide/dipeptide ABC transporter ATP-binding protein